MAVEFAAVFVLHTKEQVVVDFLFGFIHEAAEFIFYVLGMPWVSEVVLLHSNWVQDNFIFPGVEIPPAKVLNCAHCIIHELEFDVFSHAVQILLHLLLCIELVAVSCTKVDAELLILLDYIKRKVLQLDIFVFFECLYLTEQFFCFYVLVVLVLEEFGL